MTAIVRAPRQSPGRETPSPRFPPPRPVAPVAANCRIDRTPSAGPGAARRPPDLGARADAAVVDQRRRVRQQPAQRHEAKVPHRWRQFRRQLLGVLGQQNAAPAESLAGLDRRLKKLMCLAIGRAGRKRDRCVAGGQKILHLVRQLGRVVCVPQRKARPTACSRGQSGCGGPNQSGNKPSTRSLSCATLTEHARTGASPNSRRRPLSCGPTSGNTNNRSDAQYCNRLNHCGTRGPENAPLTRGES